MYTARGSRSRSVAAMALGLACVLALTGCISIPVGGDTRTVREMLLPEGADTTSTVATSTPATSTAAGAMTGTWLTAGSWKVMVVRTRTATKGPGGVKAGKGKRFLLVEVEFKNARLTEALIVKPKDFTLKDESGKKYAAVGDRISGYNGAGMREIGPGYGGWTVFAYRIPKGSSGYTFTFAPKVAGKRAKLQWGVP